MLITNFEHSAAGVRTIYPKMKALLEQWYRERRFQSQSIQRHGMWIECITIYLTNIQR